MSIKNLKSTFGPPSTLSKWLARLASNHSVLLKFPSTPQHIMDIIWKGPRDNPVSTPGPQAPRQIPGLVTPESRVPTTWLKKWMKSSLTPKPCRHRNKTLPRLLPSPWNLWSQRCSLHWHQEPLYATPKQEIRLEMCWTFRSPRESQLPRLPTQATQRIWISHPQHYPGISPRHLESTCQETSSQTHCLRPYTSVQVNRVYTHHPGLFDLNPNLFSDIKWEPNPKLFPNEEHPASIFDRISTVSWGQKTLEVGLM